MFFKLADQNNDGQISQKEAIDAGNLIVGGFFFRADQNGDGVLSQEEARQAREMFLSTKPWLRYAVETARATKKEQGETNKQNPLRTLATTLDTNNDKQLQASELRQGVQTTVQSIFATADTNRDGQLSPTEVNAAIEGMGHQLAQAAFQQADTDNNGQISQSEWEKAVMEPARVAFHVMDLNHDGQLSQQEAQTARQVLLSAIRSLNVPEPPNSPRNRINQAIGNPPQPPASPTQPRR
jgi:Ca2+-binding EF-hand superfamily protein